MESFINNAMERDKEEQEDNQEEGHPHEEAQSQQQHLRGPGSRMGFGGQPFQQPQPSPGGPAERSPGGTGRAECGHPGPELHVLRSPHGTREPVLRTVWQPDAAGPADGTHLPAVRHQGHRGAEVLRQLRRSALRRTPIPSQLQRSPTPLFPFILHQKDIAKVTHHLSIERTAPPGRRSAGANRQAGSPAGSGAPPAGRRPGRGPGAWPTARRTDHR